MKMCPCEHCHAPLPLQRPCQPHRKADENMADSSRGRSPLKHSGESWVAKYCCEFSALGLSLPFLENGKGFLSRMAGPGETLPVRGFAGCLPSVTLGESLR